MAEGTDTYRLANDEVVSDVIDGETVLVNLATGSYYTANPTGGLLWSLATGGCTREEAVREVSRRFSGESADVRLACEQFLERLCEEGLLARGNGNGVRPPDAAPPAAAVSPATFEPPVLTKYTDMEDLLSLDPIHEVDELGWPHVKRDGTR